MAAKKNIEEIVEEQVEPTVEVEEAPAVEEPAAPAGSTVEVISAGDGDSYASLAARFVPAGVSARVFARELYALNGGAVVRPGSRIRIPR